MGNFFFLKIVFTENQAPVSQMVKARKILRFHKMTWNDIYDDKPSVSSYIKGYVSPLRIYLYFSNFVQRRQRQINILQDMYFDVIYVDYH